MKNERQGIVEGSTHSETEKETPHRVGAGDVGAPANVSSFATLIGKNRMMVTNLDPMGEPVETRRLKEGASRVVGE